MKTILDEDGEAVAAPALRMQAYWPPGGLSGADGAKVLDGVRRVSGAGFRWAGGTMISKKETLFAIKPKHFEQAFATLTAPVDQFRLSDAVFASGSDGYGPDFPSLRINESIDMTVFELAVPTEIAVGDVLAQVWEPLIASPPAFAAVGYGMSTGGAQSAQATFWAMRSKARYRSALAMNLLRVGAGLSSYWVKNYNEKKQDNARPGIPDVGWKTIIGGDFVSQIDRKAIAAIPGVAVRDLDKAIEITIGDRPVWGDVNAGEDVRACAAVCRALAPIQMSKSMLRNRGVFGDGDGVTEAIEAYYALWQP